MFITHDERFRKQCSRQQKFFAVRYCLFFFFFMKKDKIFLFYIFRKIYEKNLNIYLSVKLENSIQLLKIFSENILFVIYSTLQRRKILKKNYYFKMIRLNYNIIYIFFKIWFLFKIIGQIDLNFFTCTHLEKKLVSSIGNFLK